MSKLTDKEKKQRLAKKKKELEEYLNDKRERLEVNFGDGA